MAKNTLDRSRDRSQPVANLNSNEQLKANSRYLRGTIAEGLAEQSTRAVPGDDTLLMKFHGIYMQDDRDQRAERQRRRLEPNHQFMVRLRLPGGIASTSQWLGLDALARRFAERGLRITTRQTIQLHGVRKPQLRACMQAIRDIGLDTIAACGDDSRGVICGFNPSSAPVQREVASLARQTSQLLIPKTGAYREIWYEEDKGYNGDAEDPTYGATYLPRKFKVGYALPPVNDIDVYGQDVGFIAITDGDTLLGFNVAVGGGMGQLDTRDDSYPRLAEVIGFVPADRAPALSLAIMEIQRDYGDRVDRHRARFKYTLDRLGMDTFNSLLEEYWGQPLEAARPFEFTHNGDPRGWQQDSEGLSYATLDIANGRIDGALQDQLQAFVQSFAGYLRLTTNQNLILAGVEPDLLETSQWRLDDLSLKPRLSPTLQSAYSMACVALPTCGLAMAEAERIMPDLLQRFESSKAQAGLDDVPITLRVTGCPNGCARPYIAEIALTGRAPNLYNLYLGGGFHGERLNQLYAGNVSVDRAFELVEPLLQRFACERLQDEHFGDYLVRAKVVRAIEHGSDTHRMIPVVEEHP
jgi:sulfite reductase (NADPH) hemoprotein beta-component